jgi:hypothetical protein
MGKNMVSILSNLSNTMCHAFVGDKSFMFPPISLFESSTNGEPSIDE